MAPGFSRVLADRYRKKWGKTNHRSQSGSGIKEQPTQDGFGNLLNKRQTRVDLDVKKYTKELKKKRKCKKKKRKTK